MLVYPYVGIVRQLNALTAKYEADGYTVRLYQNDVGRSLSIDTVDLVEADYPGYAPIALTGWTPAIISPPPVATSHALFVKFEYVGAGISNLIWGYWIADGSGELVTYAPLPDGPWLLAAPPDQVGLTVYLHQVQPPIV